MNLQLTKSGLSVVSPRLLDRMVPAKLLSRFDIGSKMLFGYMLLVGLTVMVVVYALVSLEKINGLNAGMVRTDITVQETADKMIDAVLAQDSFEKRYLILKSEDMSSLFLKRGYEFRNLLASLEKLPDRSGLPLETVGALHVKYTDLFEQEVQLIRSKKIKEANEISSGELKHHLDKVIDNVRNISVIAKASQDGKMREISRIGESAFFTTAILFGISIIVGAFAGLVVTRHIASSIHKLKVATEHISEGNFDIDPKIETKDEIGLLSQSFITMGKRLRQLEEMYLDASPLTRLPGGIAIENVLKKRLESSLPVAFCVLDLDNFKPFNDRYGYANGSEVIKETARIIENAVKLKGSSDDFIGHVGGDDFVVITTPLLMREVSAEIISRFDERIPDFYAPEDRARGYILGKTRQGLQMEFPIMTISIAIVTNERRKLTNPIEASEIAAELKDYAKTILKSVFVVDKRRGG